MLIENPLISVVTGCYNGEKFIERAFNSILNQTYTAIELIFVNDGSSDGSLALAKSFIGLLKKRGIKFIIVDQENQGYYPTSGIQHATGKYISTYDIDDYLMPESLAKRTQFLEKNPDFLAVRTNGYEVNEENLEDTTHLFVTNEIEKYNEIIFEELLLGKTNNWAGSYMVRASVLFEIYPNHKVPGTRFGQNLQILMPVAYKGRVGFIDEPLMKYIRNSQSLTASNHTFKNTIALYQGFKDIRIEMLDFLKIKSKNLIKAVDELYLNIFLNTAFNFGEQQAFNSYYKQLNEKSISYKIKYHVINKNLFKEYFYRVLNKLRIKKSYPS